MTDDDGVITKDWYNGNRADLKEYTFSEEFVPLGAEVCATGFYRRDRAGIFSNIRGTSTILHLYQGDPKTIGRRLWWKMMRLVFGGLLVLGLGVASIWHWANAYGRHPPVNEYRLARLNEFVVSGDVEGAREYLEHPFNINEFYGNRTVLMRARSAAMVRLLVEKGAWLDPTDYDNETSALMYAASSGNDEVVRVLVSLGADMNLEDGWGLSALEIAEDSGQKKTAALLRELGARDETVTEKNGRALQEADEPARVCWEYLSAVQNGELARMRALYNNSRIDYFENIDLEAWQNARVVKPKLDQGFMSDQYATLQLSGSSRDGRAKVWVYHIRKIGPEWMITKERSLD